MSRTYLVDGTNLSRGADYDPRFPAMEERRAAELLDALERLAQGSRGRASVEAFFDGPARGGLAGGAVEVRFSYERSADELIMDRVRSLRREGRSVVVATDDGALGGDVEAEGARVMRGAELLRLCWER